MHHEEIPSARSSMVSLQSARSDLLRSRAQSNKSLYDSYAAAEDYYGGELPFTGLDLLFVLVRWLQVDAILETAVSLLQNNIHRFPFLLYFSFVRVLVKVTGVKTTTPDDDKNVQEQDDASNDHLQATSCSSEFRSIIKECVEEHNDDLLTRSPVKIVAMDDDNSHDDDDDYGFFADFEEEPSQQDPVLEDPFQSLNRSRSSCMSALCTLEEEEEGF